MKSAKIRIYIFQLLKIGESTPIQMRTKVITHNGKAKYIIHARKRKYVSSEEFYKIPDGFRCILLNKI